MASPPSALIARGTGPSCVFLCLRLFVVAVVAWCKDVAVGEPVFLTKNGQGRYAIIDLGEYEKTHAIAQLDEALAAGERSVRREGWRSLASVKRGRERVRM